MCPAVYHIWLSLILKYSKKFYLHTLNCCEKSHITVFNSIIKRDFLLKEKENSDINVLLIVRNRENTPAETNHWCQYFSLMVVQVVRVYVYT